MGKTEFLKIENKNGSYWIITSGKTYIFETLESAESFVKAIMEEAEKENDFSLFGISHIASQIFSRANNFLPR